MLNSDNSYIIFYLSLIFFATGNTEMLSVGPIMFGIFTAGWDWILLQVKKLGGGMLADAKKSATGGSKK